MVENKTLISTKAFAERTGIPVTVITRLLREGRIDGTKRSGKWAIPANQTDLPLVRELRGGGKRTEPQPDDPQTRPRAVSGDRFLSVAEVAERTYLTETGVVQWLRAGRITGRRDAAGNWQVDADSLNRPHVKRLMRT